MRGGPFSCAFSPTELWPLSNLPGRGFDGVISCTHTSHIVVLRLIHIYTLWQPGQVPSCPRILPFLVAANVACSHYLLQIVSTWFDPYRLAQQTQILREGHFTPYDHVFILCQQMHTIPTRSITAWKPWVVLHAPYINKDTPSYVHPWVPQLSYPGILLSDLDFGALNNEHIFLLRWHQTRVNKVGATEVPKYHQPKNADGSGCGLVYI